MVINNSVRLELEHLPQSVRIRTKIMSLALRPPVQSSLNLSDLRSRVRPKQLVYA